MHRAAAGLVAVVAAAAMSVVLTLWSFTRLRSSIHLLEDMTRMHTEMGQALSTMPFCAFIKGYSERPGYWSNCSAGSIARTEASFDDFAVHYRHERKMAGNAHNAFEKMRAAIDDVAAHYEMEASTSVDLVLPGMSFDDYADAYTLAYQHDGLQVRATFYDKAEVFVHRLTKVRTEAMAVAMYISIAAQVIVVAAFAALVRSLVAICKNANARLEAQDQLVRQQAHENRNKYAPAIYALEQFDEAARRRDATVSDFTAYAEDIHMALLALREVEAQHQTRLDMYKVLRRKYVPHLETFEVLSFMRDRLSVERAISLARNHGTDAATAAYEFTVADPYRDCDEVHIRADLYVLSHVVSNLLSNSRKHTYAGSVTLDFTGSRDDGLLVFAVTDTGTGIPQHVVDNLFRHGVATGTYRGTGLGLPSCALFCQAVGGFIRLKETRLQDEHGQNGHTCFEFGITGHVVRADRRPRDLEKGDMLHVEVKVEESDDDPGVPDDVVVIVVDDSALNRRCVLRSLQQVEREAGARGWTYSQFETIEQAQPFLQETHDANKHAIVTLDVRRFVFVVCDALTGKHGLSRRRLDRHPRDALVAGGPRLSRRHCVHEWRSGRRPKTP